MRSRRTCSVRGPDGPEPNTARRSRRATLRGPGGSTRAAAACRSRARARAAPRRPRARAAAPSRGWRAGAAAERRSRGGSGWPRRPEAPLTSSGRTAALQAALPPPREQHARDHEQRGTTAKIGALRKTGSEQHLGGRRCWRRRRRRRIRRARTAKADLVQTQPAKADLVANVRPAAMAALRRSSSAGEQLTAAFTVQNRRDRHAPTPRIERRGRQPCAPWRESKSERKMSEEDDDLTIEGLKCFDSDSDAPSDGDAPLSAGSAGPPAVRRTSPDDASGVGAPPPPVAGGDCDRRRRPPGAARARARAS